MKFKRYITKKNLRQIFKNKIINSKSIGSDGINSNKFAEILDEEIDIIRRKIKNQTYRVSPYKEKLIIKDRVSNPRFISIPTVRDKLTFTALNQFLRDKFEDRFTETSVHTKIVDIKNNLQSKKFDTFIKLDIKNFFPSINHEILLKNIEKSIKNKKVLHTIREAITQYTIPEGKVDKRYRVPNHIGIPQGLPISSTLSSIYLMNFDEKYSNMKNIAYYRFVDDILILCKRKDIEKIKQNILKDIEKLNLKIHGFESNSDKSSIGDIYKEDFQYLGYLFKKGKTVSVRKKTVEKLQNRIIEIFIKYKDSDELYERLNYKITGVIYKKKHYGWLKFFALINDLTLLYSLDNFVRKCFKQFNLEYDDKKVKKFVKTYFELKKKKSKYIPTIRDKQRLNKRIAKLLKIK